jgi:hypothetical protein
MFTYLDNRFAHCFTHFFQCANVCLRHAANQAVALRVKSQSAAFDKRQRACPCGWSCTLRRRSADGGRRWCALLSSMGALCCSIAVGSGVCCDCCGVASSGRGCGGGGVKARFHLPSANRRRPLLVSCASRATCACARARLRSVCFDGALESCALPSPRVGLGCSAFGCLSVHVMVPSTWMRNEWKFASSASLAARRTARRAAWLKVARGPRKPEADLATGGFLHRIASKSARRKFILRAHEHYYILGTTSARTHTF